MIYRAIGLMSGSSLDGLDICFAELEESGGRWSYEIKAAQCIPLTEAWQQDLSNAVHASALEYARLHTAFGRYIGQQVSAFVDEFKLHHQVALIASHGHTVFHEPQNRITAQLGDGAAIAATTGLNVVSDLRNMDVALGGQGAPIVPIGEKLFFSNYDLLLNIGGIANVSLNAATTSGGTSVAFDVCPANRVLNLLAQEMGFAYDEDGNLAATGSVQNALLQQLNELPYYQQSYPKSLANDFGTDVIFPLLKNASASLPDVMRTYAEHIAEQLQQAVASFTNSGSTTTERQMLVTGGGAFNHFLMERIRQVLQPLGIRIVIPEKQVIEFKEALIMALIGVLRWREEENVLSSVTGASRSSVGGALWLGH